MAFFLTHISNLRCCTAAVAKKYQSRNVIWRRIRPLGPNRTLDNSIMQSMRDQHECSQHHRESERTAREIGIVL
jgi:hypothetical protein